MEDYSHCILFLYILAMKNFSADSFLLAFGFKDLTLLKSRVSLSWRLWARAPSQYLQTREPPGRKIFPAKSVKVKHIVISCSWSISLKPLALGAMSLRMTSAWALGRSSISLACVTRSVISWWERKWAPSRGAMFRRSNPITVPWGQSESRKETYFTIIILSM